MLGIPPPPSGRTVLRERARELQSEVVVEMRLTPLHVHA
jgi:hypothetical protein